MEKPKTFKDIYNGVVEYIYDNTTFESSELMVDTIKSIQTLTNIEDIYRKPIENRIFNFDRALKWFYFICTLVKFINDNSIVLPSGFTISFNLESAIIYLTNVYTHKQEEFLEYFDSTSNFD